MQSPHFAWLSEDFLGTIQQGDLGVAPAYVVLSAAASQRFTGTLGFERGKRIKYVSMASGQVFRVQTNVAMEGLDVVLRRGVLDAPKVDDILKRMSSREPSADLDHRIVEELRQAGILDDKATESFLLGQTLERLTNLLGWFEGYYRMTRADEMNIPQNTPLPWIDLGDFLEQTMSYIASGKTHFFEPMLSYRKDLIQSMGELTQDSGAATLMYFSSQKANGQLLMERGQRRKAFALERGKISSIVTSDPRETLEVILQRWAFLPEHVVSQLTRRVRSENMKLRETLLEEKYLTEAQVEQAMFITHVERIFEAMSWRSGTFEFKGDLLAQTLEEDTERDALQPRGAMPSAPNPDLEQLCTRLVNECVKPDHRLIVIAAPQWRESLVESLQRLQQGLLGRGVKALLICTPDQRLMPHDPTQWESAKDWRPCVESLSQNDQALDLLYLSDRSNTWATFQGADRLDRMVEDMGKQYDIVLWVTSMKDSRKSILQLGHVVLWLDRHVSMQEAMRKYKAFEGLPWQGFIFDQVT